MGKGGGGGGCCRTAVVTLFTVLKVTENDGGMM